MIILPSKKLLNRFGKLTTWQNRYNRRLKLLKFVGFPFWKPEDFAFVGPIPPEIQAMHSVGIGPHGTIAAAGVGAGGSGNTLGLTNLYAADFDAFGGSAAAGVRWLTDGDVQEQNNGSWADQNSSTEWIDSLTGESSSDYEVNVDHTTGNVFTYSSGWSDNTYIAISATRTVSLLQFGTGSKLGSGTAYVREIADTSNNVSASIYIDVEVTGGGILSILQ